MKIRVPRQLRALAALCLLLVLLLVGLMWVTVQSFWNRHIQIVTAQSRVSDILDRKRHLVGAPELSSSPASLLVAGTEGEALSLFETYLRNSIQSHGGTEISVRVGSSLEQGIAVLRADLSARIPGENILKLIYQIATGPPSTIIDSVRMRHLPPVIPNSSGEWLGLTSSVRVFVDLSPLARPQP